MKKIIGLIFISAAILFLFIRLTTKTQEECKCTNWSPSYNGAYYRFCTFSEDSKYYDELQWYNSNKYRVTTTWTWSENNENRGTSTEYFEPEEMNISSIPEGYAIEAITVERN